MGNKVFANGREISCKSSQGKSICSFPDVCLTPPSPPAGPIPIPYPNTAMASDMTSGSKTVKLHGKEAMLKNKSFFKKSMGDEAATKAQGMGVVTHQIQGKAYFIMWSMDVKFEGENVVRHLDMTTHNHGSPPANAPPMVHAALANMGQIAECAADKAEVEDKCDPWDQKATCPDERGITGAFAEIKRNPKANKPGGTPATEAKRRRAVDDLRAQYRKYSKEMQDNECRKALRCMLVPYNKTKKVGCPKQTGDHLLEKSNVNNMAAADRGNYKASKAPTALMEGNSYHIGSHGLGHYGRRQGYEQHPNKNPWTVRKGAKNAAQVHCQIAGGCDPACIEEQIVQEHTKMGVDENAPIEPPSASLASDYSKDFAQEWGSAAGASASRSAGPPRTRRRRS